MDTKVEDLENNQVKLSFTIEASEVDARIKRAYRQVAKRYSFPGFRPGKAPRPVIDSIMGQGSIHANVTEDVINDSYAQALEENNLVPLARPNYEYETDTVEDHKPYAFTATIKLAPRYELSSYEPVEVEIPTTAATDEEIDAQIDELRSYYQDYEDIVEDTEVKPGEIVEFTLAATDAQGENISALSVEKRLYELGSGVYPASFDAELIGLKAGGTKSFDLDLTDDDSVITRSLEDAGMTHCEVTIDALKKKVLPEITDEWVKEKFGFEGIEDMRTKIGDSVKAQKMASAPRRTENEVLMALAARLEGDLPEEMCEREETTQLQNFYGQLSRMGLTFDQYLKTMDMTPDKFKEDNKRQAADAVRSDLALDAWARHFKIEATEEEVHAEFTSADLEDPDAIEAEWRREGRLPMIRESIRRANALHDAVDKAKVTEVEEPSVKDDGAKDDAAKASDEAKTDAQEAPAAGAAAADAEASEEAPAEEKSEA